MSHTNQQRASHDGAEREKIQQIQHQFGAAARQYVTSQVHASGPDLDWIVEAAALTGTEYVLDVATGTGHTAFALAPQAAKVVALDLTPQMLAAAQQAATERHLHTIRFLEGNAQAIPCEDHSFDIVTCRQAAHHFPDVYQSIREWARVLKPGGKLLLVDPVAPEEPELDVFLNEIELLRDPSHMRDYRVSEWLTFLQKAGFAVSTVREWGIFLDVPSWTQRIGTPSDAISLIEQRLCAASLAARERLKIEKRDGVLAFTLPAVLIVGMRMPLD